MKLKVLEAINGEKTFTDQRLNRLTEFIIPLLLFYLAWSKGGGELFSRAIASTIIGALIILYAQNKPIEIPKNTGFFSLFALSILSIFSSLYACSPDRALSFGFTILLLVLNFILIHNFTKREGKISLLLRNLILGSIIIIAYGYKYLVIGRNIQLGHNMIKFFVGRFFWKNPMAAYIGLIIPIAFFLFLSESSRWFKGICALVIVFGGVGFVLTGSRAAWISFAGAAVISVIIFRHVISKRLILFFVGFVLAIALFVLVITPPEFLITRVKNVQKFVIRSEKTEASFADRLDLIQSAGMIFRSNPILGVGADCFAERYPQYMKRVKFASQYVHNQYLQFAAETGIIGLVFFLIFVLFSLFAPISYNDKLLGLFIFQAMLFFSLHIFFDIDWYITVLPLIFTTYIAILENKSSSKISSVIITIVAFIVIFYFVARSMGESLYNSARSDFIKGDAERSIKELKKAIYFAPLKSEIYEGIGDYYLACGDYSRGIDMYKRASKFAKLSPNPHIRLARFFVTTGAPDSAIFHYRKAISLSRSLNLNYYNELGRYLLGLGKTGEAKELFDTVANVYRWGVDWGYNERTVAHRYYVADALFELAKLERDSTKVKSFIARAESLGAPREYDFIARTFGDNFIAPEKVVKDFYDAWSDGNIALASSFLTDSSYKLVPMENKEIRVSRILDVSYDYWAGIADVVYLARLVENNSEKNIRGRFRLYRQENGWKIEPAY